MYGEHPNDNDYEYDTNDFIHDASVAVGNFLWKLSVFAACVTYVWNYRGLYI